MNLGDLIALAKQGYTPSDVKELIALADTQPEAPVTEPTQTDTLPTQTDTPAIEPTQADTLQAQNEELNKRIVELEKQLTDTNTALKNAQKLNVHTNIAQDKQSDSARIEDWARSFM